MKILEFGGQKVWFSSLIFNSFNSGQVVWHFWGYRWTCHRFLTFVLELYRLSEGLAREPVPLPNRCDLSFNKMFEFRANRWRQHPTRLLNSVPLGRATRRRWDLIWVCCRFYRRLNILLDFGLIVQLAPMQRSVETITSRCQVQMVKFECVLLLPLRGLFQRGFALAQMAEVLIRKFLRFFSWGGGNRYKSGTVIISVDGSYLSEIVNARRWVLVVFAFWCLVNHEGRWRPPLWLPGSLVVRWRWQLRWWVVRDRNVLGLWPNIAHWF